MIGKDWTLKRTAYGVSLAFVWVLLFGLCTGAQAETYRWEDTSGRTHYADSLHGVPEDYRDQAKEIARSLGKPIRVLSSSTPDNQEGAPLNWQEFEQALQEEAAKENAEADSEQESTMPEFNFSIPGSDGEELDVKAVLGQLMEDVSGWALVGMVLKMLALFAVTFFIMVWISGVILKWACSILGENIGLAKAMLVSFLQGLAGFFVGASFGLVDAFAMSEATTGPALGFQAISLVVALLADALVIRLMICQSYLKSLAITLLRMILIFVLALGFAFFLGFLSAIF